MSKIRNITPQDAFKLIQDNLNNPNFIILDVRTSKEHHGGHIKGSELMDYSQPNFAQKIQSIDQEKTYLVYCRSGVRSSNAAKIMIASGISDVYNLAGGVMGWDRSKLPLE
jgi:rhodanese-related sulfurtransferase